MQFPCNKEMRLWLENESSQTPVAEPTDLNLLTIIFVKLQINEFTQKSMATDTPPPPHPLGMLVQCMVPPSIFITRKQCSVDTNPSSNYHVSIFDSVTYLLLPHHHSSTGAG